MPWPRDLEDPLAVTLLLEVTKTPGEHRGQRDDPDDLTARTAGDHPACG